MGNLRLNFFISDHICKQISGTKGLDPKPNNLGTAKKTSNGKPLVTEALERKVEILSRKACYTK